ncbi:MAG: ASPIC/UnbV domain-containing protein, partial [Paracoccaceae bacterium]
GDPVGGWVQVRLSQAGANRDAIGAVVELRRGDKIERHEILSGGGHLSGSVGWLHYGLGQADAVELRVIWPDGSEGDWLTLPARSFHILRPGEAAEVWQPR